MKLALKYLMTLTLLTFCQALYANTTLNEKIGACKKISSNDARLTCYDGIDDNIEKDHRDATEKQSKSKHKNEFPTLVGDLNEPSVFISYGQLDLLGSEFNAVLLGGGIRELVKEFHLTNGRSISFNVFGQIRSQFEVEEIDTRNNRGGALINTDFSVGGEIIQSLENWNWRLSYTHKSTHLGDEFIIDNQHFLEDRINLSYETLRWTAHKNLNQWDIYAGLGVITRSEPGGLDKSMWQLGWQFKGNFWRNIKPIWAVDLNSWGAYDWNTNINMRAGIEVHQLTNKPFKLLLEYQDGHSPYGQFYTEDLTFTGLTFMQNW